MKRLLVIALFGVQACLSQEASDACPAANGFFADAVQCDRYYECRENEIEDKLCPDGLVFSDKNSKLERCDFPFNVDCGDRPELQDPQPSTNCPRKNGYFPHRDPSVCDQFFFCSDGQFNLITCSPGLVFDAKTGTCAWPGEANRVGCSGKDVNKFTCPEPLPNDGGVVNPNPLYADPEDCQHFYVCINNVEPRRNGCPLGYVFNDDTKQCDDPANVPECKDFYGEVEEK
uniref:Obstructor B1 n=2 Tax=Penaeus TaxID=133894 RepID=A0A6S4ILQ8_PENVA|nr:obstructor B1 [Penaeus vannamei]